MFFNACAKQSRVLVVVMLLMSAVELVFCETLFYHRPIISILADDVALQRNFVPPQALDSVSESTSVSSLVGCVITNGAKFDHFSNALRNDFENNRFKRKKMNKKRITETISWPGEDIFSELMSDMLYDETASQRKAAASSPLSTSMLVPATSKSRLSVVSGSLTNLINGNLARGNLAHTDLVSQLVPATYNGRLTVASDSLTSLVNGNLASGNLANGNLVSGNLASHLRDYLKGPPVESYGFDVKPVIVGKDMSARAWSAVRTILSQTK